MCLEEGRRAKSCPVSQIGAVGCCEGDGERHIIFLQCFSASIVHTDTIFFSQ